MPWRTDMEINTYTCIFANTSESNVLPVKRWIGLRNAAQVYIKVFQRVGSRRAHSVPFLIREHRLRGPEDRV